MYSVTLVWCVQGDYKKGGGEAPTLVYELACDADLWVFHCNFSAPGSNNDLNVHQSQHHCKFICRIIIIIIIQVLDASPLLDAIGLGHTLASFSISEHKYIQPYLLVDGIYPKWTWVHMFLCVWVRVVWPRLFLDALLGHSAILSIRLKSISHLNKKLAGKTSSEHFWRFSASGT